MLKQKIGMIFLLFIFSHKQNRTEISEEIKTNINLDLMIWYNEIFVILIFQYPLLWINYLMPSFGKDKNSMNTQDMAAQLKYQSR